MDLIEAVKRLPKIASQIHRMKTVTPKLGLWPAMVTKVTHPKDHLARSREALAAVDSEKDALISDYAWDHNNPCPASEVKAEFPDADSASLFLA